MLDFHDEYPLAYLANRLRRFITRFDCLLFLAIFSASLLVHLYMFTHKFINHDDVSGLYSDCSFGLSSGRWLLKTITGLTGNFSSSWLNGLAGAVCLAAAAVLIARLFRMQHLLPALLMGVCLVSFPTVASTYAYMFCSTQYLFALAFSVLGAVLIRQERLLAMIAGSVAIALAMGCYQAYFCLAAALLLTVCGLDLLEDRYGDNWKDFFFTALKYVTFLALGMVLYFVILKVCLWATGTQLISYQGIDTMGRVSAGQLINRIKDAYLGFRWFVLNGSGVFHSFFPLLMIACGLLTLVVVAGAVWSKRLYRRPMMMTFLALVLLLFPLACCLVYVMVDASMEEVHQVMLFPTVLPLILPAVALDRLTFSGFAAAYGGRWKKELCLVLTVALLVVQGVACYECIFITNRAYFCMDITYENVYAYYTKLTAKLEMQEDYTPESRVAFIGTASMDSFVPSTQMTGVITGNDALNIYSYRYFLKYYLGTHYDFIPSAIESKITATEEFTKMPCYPAEGSIRTIDGIITVKFS